jgi:hypothetical protein
MSVPVEGEAKLHSSKVTKVDMTEQQHGQLSSHLCKDLQDRVESDCQ